MFTTRLMPSAQRALPTPPPSVAPTGGRRLAAGLTVAAALATALLVPGGVAEAGRGSVGSPYEGQFTSTAPSGYPAAPATVAAGTAVDYRFTVTTSSLVGGTPGGNLYLQRITSVDGQDVSTGAPALAEDRVLAGSTVGSLPTAVALDAHSVGGVLGPASVTYQESVRVGGCGYWAIWVQDAPGGTPDLHSLSGDVLNAGVVRVACAAAAAPASRPLATGSPSPSPSPSAPASPQPTPVQLAVVPAAVPLQDNLPSPSASAPAVIAAGPASARTTSRARLSLALGALGVLLIAGGAVAGPAVIAVRRRRRPALVPDARISFGLRAARPPGGDGSPGGRRGWGSAPPARRSPERPPPPRRNGGGGPGD